AYMTDRESASVEGLRALGVRFVVDANLASRVRGAGGGPPPKLIVMPGLPRRDAVLKEMRDLLGERVYLARTGEDRLEIMSRGVNKGAALQAICEACGASMTEALAIGDGDNDLPMLKAAGIGMLMENADDQTKSEAEDSGIRLVPPVQSDGFVGALSSVGLGAGTGTG
ncbi:MAG: HAD hydrolase family protein, partial [Candidatus Latescibacteria bacterium]|nr:HAD hydrolase family protein [Candidatus Latescibacterota bacterium]